MRDCKHKIIIQKLTDIVTDDGFNEERKWIDWKPVWASKNNLWGKEFYAAKAVNEEKTVEFRLRYFKDIDMINSTEYSIFHDGKQYDITFIDNVRYEGNWVVIKTVLKNRGE